MGKQRKSYKDIKKIENKIRDYLYKKIFSDNREKVIHEYNSLAKDYYTLDQKEEKTDIDNEILSNMKKRIDELEDIIKYQDQEVDNLLILITSSNPTGRLRIRTWRTKYDTFYSLNTNESYLLLQGIYQGLRIAEGLKDFV